MAYANIEVETHDKVGLIRLNRPQALNAITITMWSSGEKMNYLKDLAAQFNQEGHTARELFPDGPSAPIFVQAYKNADVVVYCWDDH